MKSFKDYMYYLLTTPLKKIAKIKNQYSILFNVVGRHFDHAIEMLFFARNQSMIEKASDSFLYEHGKDRHMQRYNNESLDNYRKRLMLKNEIAEKAGSNEGILLALKSIGYSKAFTEPFYIHDESRWAEFIVFLDEKEDGIAEINDIGIVDLEVRKVKQASSLPSYGSIVGGNHITIYSKVKSGFNQYPLCNTILCGVYPSKENFGLITTTKVVLNSLEVLEPTEYEFTGCIAASEKVYQEYEYVKFIKNNSNLNINSNNPIVDANYPFTGEIAVSEKTYQEYEYVEFIKNNSNLDIDSNNPIGDNAYPICGIEITSEGDEK